MADDEIYLVVNAGCREKDLAHIGKHLDKYKVCGPWSSFMQAALWQIPNYFRCPC